MPCISVRLILDNPSSDHNGRFDSIVHALEYARPFALQSSLLSMALLDLPPELLTFILKHLGAKEIRSSVQYLLISKAWYRVALPVYLSELSLSTVYLSSHDLELIPPPQTPLADLIAAKIERLSVRLVGHPSKQIAQKAWHHCAYGISDTASSDDNDEIVEDKSGWDYWMIVGPVATSNLEGGRQAYLWHTEEHQLHPWMKRVNLRLSRLSGILPLCRNIEEFSLEASSEDDPALGPRWDYLLGSTFKKIIRSLPVGLKKLTIDTCGSALASSLQDRTPTHLCSLLALRLSDFHCVRIRMRHICPDILDRSNDLSDSSSRLRSLIIRLSLPFFPEASYEKHDGHTEFDALLCPSYASAHQHRSKIPLYRLMIKAGRRFNREMKGLDMMRISYRPQKYGRKCINLYLADCISGRVLYEPSEVFTYEDDGRVWDAWEDMSERLMDGGPLCDA